MADIPSIISIQDRWRRGIDSTSGSMSRDILMEWRRVELALEDDIFNLAEEMLALEAAGEPITASMLYRQARYNRLILQAQAQIASYHDVAIGMIEQGQVETIGQANTLAGELASASAGEVVAGFDRLNPEAVQQISALLRNRYPPLLRILEREHGGVAELVGRHLIAGAARGENPRKITRRIIRDGLSQVPNHTLLVARDQIVRANRETGRQAYLQSGRIKQYRRVAARNDRTCIACIVMDGTIYEVNELMELHPQDRCSMLPIVAGFRDPYDRLGSARDWFDQQPAGTQQRIMGRQLHRIWQKRGKNGVDWQDLVTIRDNSTWGKSAVPTSARAIRSRLGIDPQGNKGGAPPAAPAPAPATVAPPAAPVSFVPEFKRVKDAKDYFSSAEHMDWNGKGAKVANLPELQELAAGAARLFDRHGIRLDFVGLDADNAIKQVQELERLAAKWPEVADRLEWVGTYKSKRILNQASRDWRYLSGRGRRWGRGEMAHAIYSGSDAGRYIGLNASVFSTLERLIGIDKRSRSAGFLAPAFDDGGGTMVHEWGHLVDAWLRDLGGEGASITPAYSGRIGLWRNLHLQIFKGILNETAGEISRYATTNKEESFAELFAWLDSADRGYVANKPEPATMDLMRRYFAAIPQMRALLDDHALSATNWYQSDPLAREESIRIWNDLMRQLGIEGHSWEASGPTGIALNPIR